jgi:DNA-binding IclR family transcriptional regulator
MRVDGAAEPIVVESVLRALRLLDCFERGRPEMTLAEFVRRGGYSKTTTYRLLNTLVHAGWLERGSGGLFRLTTKPFELGSILTDSLDIRHEGALVMTKLADACQQSVFLVVPAGTRAVCLERVDVDHALRIAELRVGDAQPLYLGAGPRALLAYAEDDLLLDVLAEGLVPRTPATLTTVQDLTADLAQTRARGFSISDGDVTRDVAAIGAPGFDSSGDPIAALSIGGLASQILPPRPEHVELLKSACRELSRRLGFQAPPRHGLVVDPAEARPPIALASG